MNNEQLDDNLKIFGTCKYIEGMTKAADIVRKHNIETSDPRVIYYILSEIRKELEALRSSLEHTENPPE